MDQFDEFNSNNDNKQQQPAAENQNESISEENCQPPYEPAAPDHEQQNGAIYANTAPVSQQGEGQPLNGQQIPQQNAPGQSFNVPNGSQQMSGGQGVPGQAPRQSHGGKDDIINVIDSFDVYQQSRPSSANIEENKVFTEKTFSSDAFHQQPYQRPPMRDPVNNPYARPGYGGNYGNNYSNNNNYGLNGYNYPPQGQNIYNGYNGGAYVQPRGNKRSLSGGGMAAVILTVSALFILVVVFLAISSMNSKDSTDSKPDKSSSIAADTEDSGSGVTVELPVSPKPVVEEKYYEDEETGLLTVAGVAKQVSASVVDVMVYKDTSLYPYSTGSGIIISADGYIVTNAHVVEDVNAGLKVILDNDEEYKAEIVGQDKRTDIAVLKIEAENLVSAELGDSDDLELGEMVVAIGNAGGYSGTLTVGYVSGINREVKTQSSSDTLSCIQTDAAMSPGVSGGALINMYGQVVGITSSKYKNSDLDEGIGFAISTNFAAPIIEDIISLGYISGRVRVGITYIAIDDAMAELYDVQHGLLIKSIDEECDIANTDAEVGDIILELNGKEVYSEQSISEALEGCEPGDAVTARIYRHGITEDESEEFDIQFELMQDTSLS